MKQLKCNFAKPTCTAKQTAQAVNALIKAGAAYNLLDNSDFRNPVNQRGKTSYTSADAKYTIDRWLRPNVKVLVDLAPGYISVTNTDTTSARTFQQKVTALNGYNGPVTVAACLDDGTILLGTVDADSDATSGNQYLWTISGQDKGIGAILYNEGYYKALGLNIESEKTVNIVWVAMYKGEYTLETLPEYAPKGYAVELMECLRYYHVYSNETARPSLGIDCSPPMRLNSISQGTFTIEDATYFFNSADL